MIIFGGGGGALAPLAPVPPPLPIPKVCTSCRTNIHVLNVKHHEGTCMLVSTSRLIDWFECQYIGIIATCLVLMLATVGWGGGV